MLTGAPLVHSGSTVSAGSDGSCLEVGGDLIDLDRGKAGDRDVKALDDQNVRQFRQLARQQLTVPAGVLGDLVVGKGQRASFWLRQPLNRYHRDLL